MTKERIALLETQVLYSRGDKNTIAKELGDFLVSNPHQHSDLHQRASNLLAKISPDFQQSGMASLIANERELAHNVTNASFDLYDSSVYSS